MLKTCFVTSFLKRVLEWIFLVVSRAKIWNFSKQSVLQIHSKDSSLTKHLIQRRGLLRQPFYPPFILRSGYLQTLVGLLFKPLDDFQFRREYLQMADKGVVALDWFIPSVDKYKRSSPILLIFPQLTGDALSVGSLCKLGASKGMRSVVFNRRGHCSSFLFSANLTSFGDTRDTRKVVEYINTKFPHAKIIGVGIGRGCATLFSYLGEFGSSSLIKASVNISPSYDSDEIFCQHIPKFYELYTLLHLKLFLLRNWKVFCRVLDLKSVLLQTWTLRDFEYHVYCKIYGIETFEAFSQRFDPMRDVDDIAMPVLCINSLDDPVSIKENIPFDLFQYYPNLLLVTSEFGGHCAFYENVHGDSWAFKIAVNYAESILEFVSNAK